MKEINREEGKVYAINDCYFLEKNYDDLLELIEDEKQIKRRASNAGFTVIGSNWYLQENPNYKIEKVMNTGLWQTEKAIRYIFKLKLKL
jgi:ribonuclease D|tara:strand:+ start:2616 stop:2882 length:267 start_codon:yes stop_codon:yes gene_type:complete